jgi:hypothetical protein
MASPPSWYRFVNVFVRLVTNLYEELDAPA